MLYVIATPIGNLGDLSKRAVDILRSADLIACEDTRRTRQLLAHFDVPAPRMFSYREQTEQVSTAGILPILREGKSVALCTNAGYPGISDPGYRLIAAATAEDLPVDVIPGASAVHVALLLSGLSTSSYTFKGFPPRKPGALRRFYEQEKDLPHTLVVFESPFRIGASLKAAHEVLGNRAAAVCLELTKKFQRVQRGFLADLATAFAGATTKGEATIVIAGNNPKFAQEETTEPCGEPDAEHPETDN